MEISGACILRRETKAYAEVGEPMLPRKTSSEGTQAPVPKTDTGGQVEHTEAIGRTMVKELGILTP